jgi:hypothetical protein
MYHYLCLLEKFTIDNATGELKYKKEQTQVSVHKVTIIATDVAGNETEQLITVSVKAIGLSTSITWGGIGDDNKININELATANLSGTVAIIGIVNSIRISGIVFKQNDTVYRIDSNLPSVDVNNNTWTLDNSNAWTSQLTKGNCTIIVYLSGNGGNVMNSNSIVTSVDIIQPNNPAFNFVDTGLSNNDGITSNGLITVNGLEVGATWQYSVSGDNGFVNGSGNSFTLANNTTYEAISNTFIYGATIKVGCLSVINSSCNRGVDTSINCSGLQIKYWVCVIYDNTRSWVQLGSILLVVIMASLTAQAIVLR